MSPTRRGRTNARSSRQAAPALLRSTRLSRDRVANYAIAHATVHAIARPTTRSRDETTARCCARPSAPSVWGVNLHDPEGSTVDTNGISTLAAEQDLYLAITTANGDSQPTTRASSNRAATPILMTIPEVAAGLRIGRSTVYELISRGGLEVVHIGRAARIPVQAVNDLVQRLRGEEASSSHPAASVS